MKRGGKRKVAGNSLLFVIIALMLATTAFADQILLVTVKTDGTTYKITDTELSSGYAPQVYTGGQYTLTKDGQTVATGNFPLPGEVVLERFNTDGTIDGEIQRQRGTFTVAIPANVSADSVSLFDSNARPIGSADINMDTTELNLDEIASEGSFFITYEWLLLLVKWIVIIVIVVVVIRKLLKMRKRTQ